LAVAPDQPINGPDDLPSTPKSPGVRTAALQ
jgi:hypothetical protein